MSNAPTQMGIIMRPGMLIRRSKKAQLEEMAADNSSIVQKSEDFVSTYKIGINKLQIDANIGVYPHEMGQSQPLILDIEIAIATNHKIENDDLETTIDYDILWNKAKDLAQSRHFKLVETYVNELAKIILQDLRIANVKIIANKPQAIKNAQSAMVIIELRRN
jgi:7,8-dihydroneopterin aldolase/epimerase/oxygenase